jgi:CubicO group peptidase (beta-lactamase class C family)
MIRVDEDARPSFSRSVPDMEIRKQVLIVLVISTHVLVPQAVSAQESNWPTTSWRTASPESQNISAAIFSDLDDEIRNGSYGFVDRMIVISNGYLVVNERYDNDYREISRGYDNDLGCGFESCQSETAIHPYNYFHPDYHPFYQGSNLHSLQSVTKSVASTLVGAALTRGEIESLATRLGSFFSDYNLSGVDERFDEITLEDLLTMRSGIEWHEQDRPLDETNTTLQLERSDDWIQFTLDQPMDADPGEKWAYSSGGSHLMSGIIRQATGDFIDEYAERVLFGPLGIHDYHWKKTPRGYPDTEGGLYLEAEQLAKIAYLYLQDGIWEDQRILSQEWVQNATSIQADNVNPYGWGYGYQWWRLDRGDTVVWAGLGFGGQFLFILPEYDLIGVVNCWNLFGRTDKFIQNDFLSALIEAADG